MEKETNKIVLNCNIAAIEVIHHGTPCLNISDGDTTFSLLFL